jgi:hypothetical protein
VQGYALRPHIISFPARIFPWALMLPLLLLINSCSVALLNGYRSVPGSRSAEPVSWFTTDSGYFLLNTKIDMMKNHFSGLMVIKPENDGAFRVVFITEVGLKVFDMEFMADRHEKVHYILEAMNKKVLINKLSGDLSLVLMNGLPVMHPRVWVHKEEPITVFRYKNGIRNTFYYLRNEAGRPYLGLRTSCIMGKVRADFHGNQDTGIDSVKIRHNNIRLEIRMSRIIEDHYAAE